jgi:chitinase
MRRPLYLLLLLASVATQVAAGTPLWGPYKDVTQGIDPARPLIAQTDWERSAPQPAVWLWAFATGECGQESWGHFDTDTFARLNIEAFERSRRDFIVSTGGEAGGLACSSEAGMRRFLARYDSPRLLGLDFDIERNQSREQIDGLVRLAQLAQRWRPALRISFTVATHAGSDGSGRSLNATGERVLAALRDAKFEQPVIINLMVMNYGPADPRWCVVSAATGRCDMARSAVQAVRNVHQQHGIPYRRLAVTAMLGENDVAGNVFTLADAQALARDARRLGLAGVHWWSQDRDQACAEGQPRVSPRCHALPGVPGGAFLRGFAEGLGGTRQ